MLLLISLCTILALGSCELRFVIGIWRHGDRAPGGLAYPLDKYNESSWPRGYNQLTNKGIEETFELGRFLNTRYVVNQKFLPTMFDNAVLTVTSSDSDRALQSAYGVMAGLFPAEGSSIWNTDQLRTWQPIPVHVSGSKYKDPLLRPTSYSCPKYHAVVREENAGLEAKINEKYADLYKRLSNETGYNPFTFQSIKRLYDISREMIHGLPQPAWVTEKFQNETIIDIIKEIKRITRTAEFNSKNKAKLRGGFLLNDWLVKLQETDKYKERKAIFYSSHDGTLNSLLYAMNVSDDQLIPTGALVVAELHRVDSQSFVQLWYRTGTNMEQLKLPDCVMDCPLDKFVQILSPMRIRNMDELNQMCKSSMTLLSIFSLLIIFVNQLFNF